MTDSTTRPPSGLLPFLGRTAAAGATGALLTLCAWYLLHHATLPAFTTSNVLRGLSTVTTVVVVTATVVLLHVLRTGDGTASRSADRRGRVSAALREVLAWAAPAGLVVAILAVPLASTRLYLGGSGVDQAFRTQLLTRMTDTPGYGDMTYADIPGFYPRLWFLTGGFFARITGLEGWAAYQPWALATIAAAAAVLVPVWQRLTGSLLQGVLVAFVSTAVLLATAPEEPYSAVVALGMPAALLLADRAVHGSRLSMAGLGLFLGVSANTYTLFTAVSALSVVVIALAAAWRARGRSGDRGRSGGRSGDRSAASAPLVRLVVTGVTAVAVALVGWAPYLYRVLTSDAGDGPGGVVRGRAQHYLPEAGTELPFPFFEVSLLGVLSLICLVWLVVRRRQRTALALGAGVVTCYLWMLLSMTAPLAGTTLLGFRVESPLVLILATGGVLALSELWHNLPSLFSRPGLRDLPGLTSFPGLLRRTVPVALVLFGVATTALIARVPSEFRDHQDRALFDIAYTDTDGDGVRADGQAPDRSAEFGTVDEILRRSLGDDRSSHVVLTDEPNFMSYYPYHGYQALTAHYANPLGMFDARNAEIESWSRITDPDALVRAMDRAEQDHGWKAPDALLLHGTLTRDGDRTVVDGSLVFHMVDDIFPNEPNVRFRDVEFPGSAFSPTGTGSGSGSGSGSGTTTSPWELTQVGDLVVVVRSR